MRFHDVGGGLHDLRLVDRDLSASHILLIERHLVGALRIIERGLGYDSIGSHFGGAIVGALQGWDVNALSVDF